ncbi:dynamin family protein [Clostridium saccharobutylicum]|uniref:GTPase Era n=1 Tax=Clostridium saccharobutylicum TaxID=169679 RepID=A0A1S8MQF4_CLOSA|nr:dynamin family protein [Clostridium saccharobutylicum]OOM06426.1 GTPase Era [Clostridium saccharobutylicum]
MAQIYVKYNPYKLETYIEVNGREIEKDSTLFKVIKGKRLQEWVGKFPEMLVNELNTVDFEIKFCGMDLDWDDFEDSFEGAKKKKIIKKLDLKYIQAKSHEDINERIVNIFTDLRHGPIDDFRDAKLLKAFDNINNSVFPVNVIATMSSGKSTLINALLSKKLMPSKNEACTATITEILDTDGEKFAAVIYDENNVVLQDISELTYEIMGELNEDENVHKISAEGNIPFLDSRTTALMLVDTPGPNNAQNQAHKNTTYRAINSDSNNLILYVLNGTQLSTNDDASLLTYVADQIKKGGKQVRDRFLFVINKMDGFNPEEEDIGKAVQSAKNYLSGYGIEEPQIFPCSAYTALNIRTYFEDVDIDNLTRSEERKLPSAARDTLPMIDKFIDFESMHLEKYSTLSPSAQRELDYKLKVAEEQGNTKEQALIHCGIYSIEAAITAYVKKYAKTKKVKDLVESFEEVLESNQVLTKAKTKVATDEKAAKAYAERSAAVKAKIADGKEAEVFKEKIAALDPIDNIENKADSLKENAARNTMKIFNHYGDVIRSRDEAKRLVNQFTTLSSDSIAALTSELESVINKEVVETGEQILFEYQEKLNKIDESATDKQLDFNTVDLIKGALTNMRENAEAWCSDNFAAETVDDVGEVSYEEKLYYEKVGQEEEQIVVGSHEEKVGTKRVKTGSHRERVGSRSVKNPKKKGFFGKLKFWESEYVEEDVYETVDDYKDEDIYKTIMDYKTVMRDVFEEKVEHIEKFTVETSVIQTGLVRKLRQNLDDGIDDALSYAEDQIDNMKNQFTMIFDELDSLISEKYDELEKCANDQKVKEAELEKNKKLLGWIEASKAEIDEALDM